jgi:hypothetical protein
MQLSVFSESGKTEGSIARAIKRRIIKDLDEPATTMAIIFLSVSRQLHATDWRQRRLALRTAPVNSLCSVFQSTSKRSLISGSEHLYNQFLVFLGDQLRRGATWSHINSLGSFQAEPFG